MKHITFIGSLDSNFSRWREELNPRQVKASKDEGRFIARTKRYANATDKGNQGVYTRRQQKSKERIDNAKQLARRSRYFNKIDKNPVVVEPISSRLEKYKVSKLPVTPEVKTKYSRKIFIDSNQRKEFLTNVAKKRKFARAIRTGGKLGLGAVGLLAAGAVGYGVYRKMRKDKGKKRGRYTK